MPISNLNNDHFTQKEIDIINQAWGTIMNVLAAKTRNLSPEERMKYGSISEQNKLVVMKTLEYAGNQHHLNSPDVDYKELQADFDDRMFLAGLVSRMVEATNICNNIRITHDYDAYQAARLDYDYTKYKLKTQPGAGFESKYNDLLTFFKTSDGTAAGDEEELPTTV